MSVRQKRLFSFIIVAAIALTQTDTSQERKEVGEELMLKRENKTKNEIIENPAVSKHRIVITIVMTLF